MALSPLPLQTGSTAEGMAADSRSLDRLRQAAAKDPAGAVKQVATQFEGLFMQMVLKSMREATPKSGFLDSSDQQMYTSMLDEQLAQKIAQGGTGLAAVIARQLSRNLPTTNAPPGVASTTASPSPAPAEPASAASAPSVAPAPAEPASHASAPKAMIDTVQAAAGIKGR